MKIKLEYASICALLVVLIIPFYIAMGFTFPLGDDFTRANAARGIFDIGKAVEEMFHAWTSWSGRYTHHFLVVFLGKAAESRVGYTLVCATGVSVYWISFYGIFFELFGRKRRGDSFIIASICMLAFLSGHPNLNITYYLMTDVLGLGIGNGLVLSFIWSLCRLWNAEFVSKKLKIAVFGTSVAAIGCYEHAAIATFLAAALAFLMAYYFSHPHRKMYLRTFKVVVFFFLFSFLAMGNFKRQATRDVTLEVILAQISASWAAWKSHAFSAFFSVWGLTVLFVGLTINPELKRCSNKFGNHILPLIFGILVFFAITFGIVLVQALSDVPVTATPKLTASMSLLSSYALTFVAIIAMMRVRRTMATIPLSLVGLAFVIILVLTPNYQRLLHDLFSGKIAAYAASLEKRYTFLTWTGYEAPGHATKVGKLLFYPYPVSLGEAIPGSPDEWPSKDVSKMFGLGELVSASPDLNRAYVNIMERVPEGKFSAENFFGMYVFKNVKAGPNDTFRFHWLLVDSSISASDHISTLVLIRRQLDRPVPVFMQRMIEKKILTRDVIMKGSMLEYFGITEQSVLEKWKIFGGVKDCYMLPVAAPEWGEILAVYASLDGVEYKKVAFFE
ncbi:hypothetical protein SAMN05421830_102328 [Desulfomicrobium norvegicum]|uniref:Uncharacterized protein n=1 Tax=Desulfomicrobium norvegicum (strain DSM 1741 / NCIMB 8310) TaxID=52561 RepID=A0A8G2C1B6_DESNO|nr:hypothetical protein [Desulfomicrobium norvegicum]SFL47243.1 hypothetical protein SAMN05421830_102328 [Desulfomicrobium norvegicum]